MSTDFDVPAGLDFDARISGLKILAALMAKPTDRMHCMSEILRLRALQLRAECTPPPFQFSDAVCDLRPRVPAPLPVSPTADAFPGTSVGAVGNLSR